MLRVALLLWGCASVAIGAERLVVPLPAPASFTRTTVVYATAGGRELKADVYRARRQRDPAPVAIFLNGIGAGFLRTHPQYTGWGALATTAGFAGVAMDSDPAAIPDSFDRLVAHLRANAKALGIDPERIVVWACSANVHAALPLVMRAGHANVRGAILYYGYGPLPAPRMDLPVLLVRAGLDAPGLNAALDDVAARLVRANVPVEVINYPGGRHAFDLVDDRDDSRRIIARTLAFMREAVDPKLATERAALVAHAEVAGLIAAEQWAEADRRLQALAEAEPRNVDVPFKRALTLEKQGRPREALAEYERALALGNPNVGMIAYAAARLSMGLDDRAGALRWLERAKDIPPIRARVKEDPVFAPLRGDQRYTDLFGS